MVSIYSIMIRCKVYSEQHPRAGLTIQANVAIYQVPDCVEIMFLFFSSHSLLLIKRELSVNRKALRALTLVGPTRKNWVLDP